IHFVQNVQGNQAQGYNHAGKGRGTRNTKCTAKKRVKDFEWFKEKMLLAQQQEAGIEIADEQQDFLAD
ncbi:hypothetical protein Tco_0854859, partial [Tanacetum coccineum]